MIAVVDNAFGQPQLHFSRRLDRTDAAAIMFVKLGNTAVDFALPDNFITETYRQTRISITRQNGPPPV